MIVTDEMIDVALRAWFGPDEPAFAWLAPQRRKHARDALEAVFAMCSGEPTPQSEPQP